MKYWRGRMPFRSNQMLMEPLMQQGRTGEPSPAEYLKRAAAYHVAGRGKSRGSFTEAAREALSAWLKDKGLPGRGPITFRYRLYRHKIVTVTMTYPRINHWPGWGAGSKGFVLIGDIQSVDGLRPLRFVRCEPFALNRIIGELPQQLLGLPQPEGDR